MAGVEYAVDHYPIDRKRLGVVAAAIREVITAAGRHGTWCTDTITSSSGGRGTYCSRSSTALTFDGLSQSQGGEKLNHPSKGTIENSHKTVNDRSARFRVVYVRIRGHGVDIQHNDVLPEFRSGLRWHTLREQREDCGIKHRYGSFCEAGQHHARRLARSLR